VDWVDAGNRQTVSTAHIFEVCPRPGGCRGWQSEGACFELRDAIARPDQRPFLADHLDLYGYG
jgi:hypothetical protein